ncbi:hypothetical protein [Streptomyces platensis]|uniref:hypothetical protein n=1 Tax=Streptomyces platensis TaxID=58346 RepID=UPI0037BC12F5
MTRTAPTAEHGARPEAGRNADCTPRAGRTDLLGTPAQPPTTRYAGDRDATPP